ncbi:unnamed protein product [Lepidochelys kempii]
MESVSAKDGTEVTSFVGFLAGTNTSTDGSLCTEATDPNEPATVGASPLQRTRVPQESLARRGKANQLLPDKPVNLLVLTASVLQLCALVPDTMAIPQLVLDLTVRLVSNAVDLHY